MLVHYLLWHKERAQQGFAKAQRALELAPLNQQFIGMAERFAYLDSLLSDLIAHTEGKQDWRPNWVMHCESEGLQPCPQPT